MNGTRCPEFTENGSLNISSPTHKGSPCNFLLFSHLSEKRDKFPQLLIKRELPNVIPKPVEQHKKRETVPLHFILG